MRVRATLICGHKDNCLEYHWELYYIRKITVVGFHLGDDLSSYVDSVYSGSHEFHPIEWALSPIIWPFVISKKLHYSMIVAIVVTCRLLILGRNF